MKIGYVASSGGHWEEIQCLAGAVKEYDVFYVTERGAQTEAYTKQNLYRCNQINRHEKYFFWHFLKLCFWAARVMYIEKPDIIVSTGALMTFPFCVFAKLLGRKVVFIESFARIQNRSLTGRMVYPFADLFCVQWESMLKFYPKAKYIGGIF